MCQGNGNVGPGHYLGFLLGKGMSHTQIILKCASSSVNEMGLEANSNQEDRGYNIPKGFHLVLTGSEMHFC